MLRLSGLNVALVIIACAGYALGLFPATHLPIARYFYSMTHAAGDAWAPWLLPVALIISKIGFWIGILLVAPPVIALIVNDLPPWSTGGAP